MSNLSQLKILTEELNTKDRQIRQNEELLRLALAAAEACVWTWDIDKNKVKGNDDFYKLFNYEITTYEDFINCVHPSDIPGVQKAVENSVRDNIDYSIHYRIKSPEGWRMIYAAGKVHNNVMSGICIKEKPCVCEG